MRGVAAPKGPMTYAPLVCVIIKVVGLEVVIWTLRLRMGLGIWALGLGPRLLSCKSGLEAGILA